MSDDIVGRLRKVHRETHNTGASIRTFSCPGRINLIGEHIDYNGGHVLPAAIDRAVYLCVSANDTGKFRFHDMHFDRKAEIPVENLRLGKEQIPKFWVYPLGALATVHDRYESGFDFTFYSTIPVGAGMSSSAAITTATLYGMSLFLQKAIAPPDLALMGQRVEKEFAGVSCGIMDQFVVIHGKKDCAVLLDTRDLGFEFLDIDSRLVHFVLVDSGIKHSLRESGYNQRRRECEGALAALRKNGAAVRHLCEIRSGELERFAAAMGGVEYKRALHASTEEERTLEFHRMMKAKRFPAAGELLYASHESLRDDFEVSIPEIDRMVEDTRGIEGVYGSRMMGGGFGGCTVTMVAAEHVPEFVRVISMRFESAFHRSPGVYDCVIEDGVREIV